jgi:hypothetical protein
MDDESINTLRIFCEDLLQNKPKKIVFEKMLIELMIERNKLHPVVDNDLYNKITNLIKSIEVYLNVIDLLKIEK